MMRVNKLVLLVPVLSILLTGCSNAQEESKNGFDLTNSEIAIEKIHGGGPARDGIPSIDNPRFLTIDQAKEELSDEDPILGVEIDGVSRAYPIAILNWHEIVNDETNGNPFVVTYCPLCGSGVVFSSGSTKKGGGKKRLFGVSGLLYNSDVLLYDRETESLWSQLLGRAISGKLKGERLQLLPATHTSWKVWKRDYPTTTVLSRRTGYFRDYDRDPYSGYVNSEGIYFPVESLNPLYHPKERVLGIEIDGKFKGYPYSELSQAKSLVVDRFNGVEVKLHFDQESNSAWATDLKGNKLPSVSSFWFAWMAFHPESEVYHADE